MLFFFLPLSLTFILSDMKVIDMVKDEMVKQGKSRGTGRPGETLQYNEEDPFCWED